MGFSSMFKNLQGQRLWLSDDCIVNLELQRQAALQGYVTLSFAAINNNINRYPMKPKLHMCDHSLRQAQLTRHNPLHQWCFPDEDFIGRIKTVALRCSSRKLSLRTLERWLLRYMCEIRS